MGYAIRFTVPAAWWLTCTGSESVSERARIRHRLREYGKRVWRDILAQGALRVDRFMLTVLVAGRAESPVLAVETLKPLIDAGTDMGLWLDDDPYHRCCTVYMRDPTPVKDITISLSVEPLAQDADPVALVLDKAHAGPGVLRSLTIPDRDWLTSNMREPVQVRKARQTRIMRAAAGLWSDVALGASAGVICSVRYPDSRREYKGDPDNVAESAVAMWGAGVVEGALPASPSVFAFTLASGQSAPKHHDLIMLAFQCATGRREALSPVSSMPSSCACM